MRKFIFIALAVLLVLSFTALALAEEPQIKLGGRILVRGWWDQNIGSNAFGPSMPVDTNAEAFYTTNAYLTVDAKITDNLQAYMELETSGGNDNPQSGLFFWGTNDAKPDADLFFRQLWIQYTGTGLLGVPSGLKVGHQLLTLGEKQFYNMERFGTDAIVLFVEPTKELFIGALTAKQAEGLTTRAGDDIDADAIMATYKLDKDNTLGLFFADVRTSDVEQALGRFTVNTVPPQTLVFDEAALYNVGLHANGKIMNALTYAAEADIQFGKLKGKDDPVIDTEDVDFGGWGIMAKVGYAIPGTPLTIRASGAYGSGDDDLTDDSLDEFQYIGPTDNEGAIARFTHYTLIYERFINTASAVQVVTGAAPNRNTGIANTTYGNLGIDVTPTKDLTLSLDGFYLKATETAGFEKLLDHSVDDSLGWEVDFKGSYKITKNLTYFVEAGYFDAGDFYKDAFNIDDPKGVTVLIHGLNLTF